MSTLHAWLEFVDATTSSPRRIELGATPVTIGRTGGLWRLPDPELSEIHAVLAQEGDSFILRDLSSRSGTFLNDRSIVEAALTNLDEIRLGRTVFVFHAAYGMAQQSETPVIASPDPALLLSFGMFFHPARFWTQALETSVFEFRQTWLIHLGGAAVLLAGAEALGGGNVLALHLGFLVLASTLALILIATTCSVFFAFDSLTDAPHRLKQSLRFTFWLAPFLLIIQEGFLFWAARTHPRPAEYFLAAGVPTLALWILVGVESRYAFAASLPRGLAFAITASVPWNLFMTGLMSFMI